MVRVLVAVFLGVLLASSLGHCATPKPVEPRPRYQSLDVTYAISEDGRLVAHRSRLSRAYVFGEGDPRLGRLPRLYQRNPARFYGFDAVIVEAGEKYGIDPAFIKAILEAESSYRTDARSRVGATGIGQLMPGTARDLGVINPLDPVECIWGTAAHLRRTSDRFRTQNMVILASGYNAGDGAVERHLGQIAKTDRSPDLLRLVPENKETPGYIRRVLQVFDRIHRGS